MFPESLHRKYMPISKQPLTIKLYLTLLMYFRILFFLIADCIKKPDKLVITRRVTSKIMPGHYKWLLSIIAKKSYIIWDYDDQIIESGEVSRTTFDFYAKISSKIFCTHSYLAELIPSEYRHKVTLLATTDGDMYRDYDERSVMCKRLELLKSEVRLVWVATSVNLPHIIRICPWLDLIANRLLIEKGKKLSLEVICNSPLEYKFEHLKLINTLWTRQRAIDGMLNATIGIMPLTDNEFTRGKGGFKLVQYISVGLPCIASNVGYNKDVITYNCGFLVDSEQQWNDAIITLSDPNVWTKYSVASFKRWNDAYSFEKNLVIWNKILSN